MPGVAAAITIEDLRRMARRRLPDFLYAPMDLGAGDGAGSARNVARLRERLLVPRCLVDLSSVTQATALFGREYSCPFGVSAIGYAGNFRHNADLILARAAAAANIPFILSGLSNASIESVAQVAPSHVWYQLYGARDPRRTDHLVGRADSSGITVLVMTVDFPVPPRVERIMRSGVRPPAKVEARALPYVLWELMKHPAWTLQFLRHGGSPRLESWSTYVPGAASAAEIAQDAAKQIPSNQTWKDLERIRKLWPGKLVVKGILHPDDASRAIDLGVDAVTVSNHGSVKLNCMPASIDALPSIARAVGGRIPIFFDGGLRSGADILVARCLGAAFCMLGRAALYGLIAGGRPGVDRAIEIMREDVAQTMAMIGCPSTAELGAHFLQAPAS